MADSEEVEIIQRENVLKGKVGSEGPSESDLRAIQRAQAAIGSLSGKYIEIADEDLANLNASAEKMKSDPANRASHLKRVFLLAHDMKGQGGSFGFPMISMVSNQLCRFIEKIEDEAGEVETEVISLYVNALNVVVRGRIKDADDKQAQALLSGLDLVSQKILK
ncbi:MAG: hypothetical protein HN403_10510 [Rhodospirillales bacterium]|jgi:chemotaxis protein histidine kinase CheA|nr:hypothetical protein [Rhodospirillales bacterium]